MQERCEAVAAGPQSGCGWRRWWCRTRDFARFWTPIRQIRRPATDVRTPVREIRTPARASGTPAPDAGTPVRAVETPVCEMRTPVHAVGTTVRDVRRRKIRSRRRSPVFPLPVPDVRTPVTRCMDPRYAMFAPPLRDVRTPVTRGTGACARCPDPRYACNGCLCAMSGPPLHVERVLVRDVTAILHRVGRVVRDVKAILQRDRRLSREE